MAKQEYKPFPSTVTEEGIKVDIGGGWWITFVREWDNLELRSKFLKVQDDVLSMKYMLKKIVAWNLPGFPDWEPIPFDREGLTAQLDAFLADETGEVECWRVPMQIQDAMVKACIHACRESGKLPLPTR